MQNNQSVILLSVERARQKLYRTQKRYGLLSHPKVIEQSRILDELLNHYHYKKTLCQ